MKSRLKVLLFVLIILPVYFGPYLYVYGMTQLDVFPRVEDGDLKAMDNLRVLVDTRVNQLEAKPRTRIVDGQIISWNESTYVLTFRFLNRIFPTYIKFPALLEVTNVKFEATGIFNGTIIMHCTYSAGRLIAPTGFEVITVFGSILKAGNNTSATSICTGPGRPVIDFQLLKSSPQYLGVIPVTLSWSLSATLRGEKVEQTRFWDGNQQARAILT